MTTEISERDRAALERSAKHYGVSIDEALRRYEVMTSHAGDPNDPICVGCTRRPHEIYGYAIACMESEDDDPPTDDEVREYVINEEGTYNPINGHFLCDGCYILNGSPSSSSGWRCP